MADNVVVTAGTGTTIHSDEYTHTTLGSGKTQLVKLVDGTLDSSTAIASGSGTATNALRVELPTNGTGTVGLNAGTNAIGKLSANSGVDIGDVDVTSSALPTGASTLAEQQTQTTSLQKIDNIAHSGSDVALSEHVPISGQFDDVATTTVTENQIAPLRITSDRALHVQAQANSGVDIGDVTINNATIAVTQSGTWDEVGINDSGNSITVDGTLTIGDGTDNIDVLAAGADNVANTENQLVTAAMLYAYDGTTYDRVTNGGGTEASALRVTLANDSTGLVSVDDNGSSLTVDYATTGSGTATGALRVELPTNGTGVVGLNAGSNNIGDVDVLTLPNVTLAAGTNTNEVVGDVAQDVPIAGNPVAIGIRASTAIPTAMSGDGDVVYPWGNRNGAQMVSMAPHIGLNSDPWNLVHEAAQYTSTQTSTVLVAGGASEKIVVTKLQIQAFATTAFDLQVYFGTGAFVRGTNRACFDGTFKPSSTLAPGAIMDGPFIAGTNGDDLMVTTSAAGCVTINVWYYVVT